MTVRVVVVDDQDMLRSGFAALLSSQSDIRVVGEAPNGPARRGGRSQHVSRRVLMDVRMPEKDGLEATRQLLDPPPGLVHRPKVLMPTTFDIDIDIDDYVYEALHAGASGFLLKDAPVAELVQAVRVIAAGEALLAPSVPRRFIEDVARRRPAPRQDPRVRGTPRPRPIASKKRSGPRQPTSLRSSRRPWASRCLPCCVSSTLPQQAQRTWPGRWSQRFRNTRTPT